MDDIYTHALKTKYVAYVNLSCLEMITYLKSNYYKISPSALKENSDCMTSAYEVNQPFETVIDQIKTDVNFADFVIVPFIPNQYITTAYDLILLTGYFTNSC